ncbi:conjugative transposon protein TraM [Segetibacter koreensis]|uniref:conjugative transposon protein TraM n=1 Tax=Segetibacter koreensis TaxID=398037 RepID=UPI00036F12F8|nr:conjugative transposon protein TraM [Segetibacter koreensis]
MKRLAISPANKAKFLRQRRFFLFLPVLVLPSVCVLFYLLGGGSNTVKAEEKNSTKGLNTSLPNANIKKDSWSKMQYYEQADQDSIKRDERIRNENAYSSNSALQPSENKTDSISAVHIRPTSSLGNSTLLSSTVGRGDADEEAVMAKLAQIDKAMNASSNKIKDLPIDTNYTGKHVDGNNNDEIKRLEKLMKMANSKDDSDEEMNQLNGMLDKIMDVQHPERVKEKIQEEPIKNKQQVYPISMVSNETPITLLETKNRNSVSFDYNKGDTNVRLRNAFYSLDEPDFTPESNNAVPAVIDETKTVTNGSTVKLRIGQDVYLGGLFVAKNTAVFGVAQLNGERLHILINSIRYDNSILPVSLTVFDLDGLEGIYIPGAIAEEVIKNSTDQAVSAIGIGPLDPSLKAQAANAGIEAAKSLLSKKVRLIKVTLKAGYQLLLKANNAS